MDGDYLPITYGDENPDTQFLVHNSISRYVSKVPSMGSQARAIKLALPGHTPYVIANIHGPFSRDEREKLDECLAQLPDLGIPMGDFNDCVWGRPSQPTRYWHPLLESGALLDPIVAHAPNTDPQNLSTHCRGRRLDAVLFSPTAWGIHPRISADTIAFPHAGDHKAVRVTVLNPLIGTAASGAAGHWQCVALALLVIPQVFAPHVPMVQSAVDSPRSHHAPTGQGGRHDSRIVQLCTSTPPPTASSRRGRTTAG